MLARPPRPRLFGGGDALGARQIGKPFTVETVSTFHDDKKGSLRGENAIHILRAEGMTLVHCGDLGHELSEKQLAAVKGAMRC